MEENEVKEVKEKPREAQQLIAVENGVITPTDHTQLKTVVIQIASGGGFPKRFDTLPKQIAAYNLARSLMRDRWQIALNHIAEIQGQMMIYGELPRALAESTGQVKEFKVYAIDRDYKEICVSNKNLDAEVYAGVCDVQREGRERKQYTYTIEEAKKAGQYPPVKPEWKDGKRTGRMLPNEDSPWFKFTKVMLMRKAQALGGKFEFPDALAGAAIAEYDAEELPDLVATKDVTPGVDKAALINEKFNRPLQAVAPTVVGSQ